MKETRPKECLNETKNIIYFINHGKKLSIDTVYKTKSRVEFRYQF